MVGEGLTWSVCGGATRAEIDDAIIDHAAELFARHGYKETSVQRIADATGYSKTGLLHRFASKEALWAAVVERCTATVREVSASAAAVPPGPARDLAVLRALADVSLRHRGFIALILSAFSQLTEPGESALLDEIGAALLAAFGLQPTGSAPARPAPTRPEVLRLARVTGALGALAVTALGLRNLPPDNVREHLVTVSYDALGHPHPAGH